MNDFEKVKLIEEIIGFFLETHDCDSAAYGALYTIYSICKFESDKYYDEEDNKC